MFGHVARHNLLSFFARQGCYKVADNFVGKDVVFAQEPVLDGYPEKLSLVQLSCGW